MGEWLQELTRTSIGFKQGIHLSSQSRVARAGVIQVFLSLYNGAHFQSF
jgi:hypothetical protein